MHKMKVLGILAIMLLMASCKKDDGDKQQTDAFFETFETLNSATDKFLEYAEAQNGNHKGAIVLTGQWLEEQPGVALVDFHDSINIRITMESGKKTYLSANELDAQGNNLYRGGGGGNAFKKFDLSGSCANKIENKHVLIYAAAYDGFYSKDPSKLQRVVDLFEDADDEFEVTVLKDGQCTPEMVETFGNYGFVSLETHGLEESFMTGVVLNIPDRDAVKSAADLAAVIQQQLGANYAQWFNEGKIMLGSRIDVDPLNPDWWEFANVSGQYNISVSGLYIESLAPLSNTVILGNMCFSGTTSNSFCGSDNQLYEYPIGSAFQSRNPISYYGYAFDNGSSRPLVEEDAQEMIWELAKSFLNDGDSTGNAHLDSLGNKRQMIVNSSIANICGSPFYLQHFGNDNYCYGSCSDTMIDGRDQQVYKTVCIGNQRWMAENLNWAGAGECYDGNNANCDAYGRLYTIADLTGTTYSETNPSGVRGICPQGWHVPSAAEWQQLFDFCGGDVDAYELLRSTSGWPASAGDPGTDAYGFKMLPGGMATTTSVVTQYQNMDEYGYFWSTSSSDPSTPRALTAGNLGMGIGGYQVRTNPLYTWKFSCRCVED